MAYDEQDYVDGWLTYSNWIDDLRDSNDVISSYDCDPSFRQKLLSCRSNTERFDLFWSDEKLTDTIKSLFRADFKISKASYSSRSGKSIEESKRLRDLGNKSFREGNYLEALEQYTQAVRYAPYPEEETTNDSLALALANRSAALYALKRYKNCLLDIDLALKFGYPETNRIKLLIRKVKCYHILSVWSNDAETIKDNLRTILKNHATRDIVKSEIQAMFEFIDQTNPLDMEKDETDLVDDYTTKISNASRTVSQGADCVEMSYDQDKGRFLMINKDVTFGRCLVAECPFVCNLAPAYRKLYCYNCFGRLHTCGISCPNCIDVLYCSEECVKSKAEIHDFECNKLLDFQERLGIVYLVFHIMFKIRFDPSIITIYNRKTSDKKPLEEFLKISCSEWPDMTYKNDYGSVLALMDHADDYEYDELMGYGLTATYVLIAILETFGRFHAKLADPITRKVLGSVILRHIMQLQTNLISILEQNMQSVTLAGHTMSGVQEHPIGVGIYPTVSLLNHSCSPNILPIFNRNKFVARAARAIPCASEITFCYGPSVTRMSKKDRQKRLKDQYFFGCRCDSCENNVENEGRALLCPDCKGPVIYNHDMTNRCNRCNSEDVLSTEQYLARSNCMKERVTEIESCCQDGDSGKLVEELLKLEKNLSMLVFWRDPIFVKIKSALIDCAVRMGNNDMALMYCEEELDLCSKTYGQNSYESIMTSLKVINMRWQKLYNQIEDSHDDDVKKEQLLSELQKLLSTLCETRGKLKDLLASTNIIGAESSYETELKFLSEIHSSILNYLAQSRAQLEGPKITEIKTNTSENSN